MGTVEVAGGWGKRIPEPKLKLKHYQNKKKVKKKRIDSPGPVQSFSLVSRQRHLSWAPINFEQACAKCDRLLFAHSSGTCQSSAILKLECTG
jgi:hypothetical protein